MREQMYGWMSLHLKGEGNGDPIKELEFKTENPEDLRCFPGDTRPKDFMTIPKFAAQEAKKLLAAKTPVPTDVEKNVKFRVEQEAALFKLLGGKPVDGS